MSKFEQVSTDTLLIDFRETEQWLRDYPQGENRSMIRDTNRRRRRDLLDRGSTSTRSRSSRASGGSAPGGAT